MFLLQLYLLKCDKISLLINSFFITLFFLKCKQIMDINQRIASLRQEMKKNGINSPNEGDSVMMLMFVPTQVKDRKPITVPNLKRVS